MRILYNLVFIIFGTAYLPYLILTKRYRYGMRDRLGVLPERIRALCSGNRIIWIHAVSLGEMKAVSILAPLLRKTFPQHRIVFTSITNTGNKVARTIATGDEGVFYLPFDLSFITDNVVKIIKPELFISLEAELWPNLIDSLVRVNAKNILVNGRISDTSYLGYRKIKFLISPILRKLSLFLMQSETDAARLLALGAPGDKVFVTGNLKFDLSIFTESSQRKNIRERLRLNDNEILLVAGSTNKGEEKQIIDCYSRLKKDHAGLRLLIAPRHIDRIVEIERLLTRRGFESIKYSCINTNPELHVFLLDTMGDLKTIYSAADIVFVGGSLVKKRGGQNPIEPAALSKPVIFGKFMSNYQDVARFFVSDGAAIQVEDKESLYSAIRLLIENPKERKKIGESAKGTVDRNSGSSQRTIDLILTKMQ